MIIALFPTREGKKGRTHKIEKRISMQNAETLFAIFRCKKRREEKTPKASAKRQKIGKTAAAGNRKREGVFSCLGARKDM